MTAFPKGKPIGRVRPPIPLPDGVAAEDCYGLGLVGDCLEPIIHDGVRIVAARGAHPKNGDFTIFWMKGQEQPGVKRIVMVPPMGSMTIEPGGNVMPIVVYETLNPERTYALEVDKLEDLHLVIGIVPAGSDVAIPVDKFIADALAA